MIHLNGSILLKFFDEVVPNVDVFTSFVVLVAVYELYRPLVITHESRRFELLFSDA